MTTSSKGCIASDFLCYQKTILFAQLYQPYQQIGKMKCTTVNALMVILTSLAPSSAFYTHIAIHQSIGSAVSGKPYVIRMALRTKEYDIF
jgi:hypothetical protein